MANSKKKRHSKKKKHSKKKDNKQKETNTPSQEAESKAQDPPPKKERTRAEINDSPDKAALAEFEIGHLLGQGSFSQVFLCTRYCDHKEYAIKVVEKRRVTRNEMYLYILQEKKVMFMMDHPNIVKLYYTYRDVMCVYLLMEYPKGGELFDLMAKAPDKKLPLELAKFYAGELVNVLEYIHSLNIVHRDLKPENILLTKSKHIKVTDFGTSKMFGEANPNDLSNSWKAQIKPERPRPKPQIPEPEGPIVGPAKQDKEERKRIRKKMREERRAKRDLGSDDDDLSSSDSDPEEKDDPFERKRYSFVGTPEYMPPEVLHNKQDRKGPEIDLWALGVIIYQMLVGNVPFQGKSQYLTFKCTLKHKIHWPGNLDENAKDLIDKLLQTEPWDRIGGKAQGGYEVLKKHPFFEGVDFPNLHLQAPPSFSVPEGPVDGDIRQAEDVTVIEDLEKEFAEVEQEDLMKKLQLEKELEEGETVSVTGNEYDMEEMD